MKEPKDEIRVYTLINSLWSCISLRRKRELISLLFFMIISGFAEISTLLSVIPFLNVLTDSKSFYNTPYIKSIALILGINEPNQLLLPATALFLTAIILSAFIRLFTLWLNNRTSALIGGDLSCNIYKRTLYKPYAFHIGNSSSKLISTTNNEIDSTAAAIRLVLDMLASTIIFLGIIIGLYIINWKVASSSVLIFIISYLFFGNLSRARLAKNGKLIKDLQVDKIKALQEGLGSIRDVILNQDQDYFIYLYKRSELSLRNILAQNIFISSSPRYVLEAFGIATIIIIALGLSLLSSSTNSQIISLLGTLALGAQRLLPSMQQIYNGWAVIKGSSASVENVLNSLKKPIENYSDFKGNQIKFDDNFVAKNINFKYKSDNNFSIENISLEIKKGEMIGIIGTTGSGKSTLLDILMGLLEPTSGSLFVDELEISHKYNLERLYAWRKKIAHVPQSIYLADSSIAENIAFGCNEENINMSKVNEAAKKARISGYIESLPQGYKTFVGERGISLSGGQIQRIAIARAFYRDCEILIFDEATSALDNNTEKEIIKEIRSLNSNLTTIMVAHRLSTLTDSDRIIIVENGKIKKEGKPSVVL